MPPAGRDRPAAAVGCILDVALTGQADFAAALASGQLFAGGPDFGGIPFTVRLEKQGDTATVEFDGTAGQQVFIDVPGATLPNNCGSPGAVAPDGKELRSGCIINGVGHIDSTTLPATGKYKVTVEARTGIGEARLRVITIKDVTGVLKPDGPPIAVKIEKPGVVGRFTFAGTKDQKVYLQVTRLHLDNECGLLALRKPGGGRSAAAVSSTAPASSTRPCCPRTAPTPSRWTPTIAASARPPSG